MEVATHVAGSVAEAIEDARGLRATLSDAAAERGAVIASAGTHPFSRWEHQEVTEHERYRALMEEMRWVAEREVIFGLHVHVGLASADEAIAVSNGLRNWLPELLALSANSPFWLGRGNGPGVDADEDLRDVPAQRAAPGVRLVRGVRAAGRARRSRAARFPTTRTSGGTRGRTQSSARSRSGSPTRRRGSRAWPASSRSCRASWRRSPTDFERGKKRRSCSRHVGNDNKWRAARDGLNGQADRPRARRGAAGAGGGAGARGAGGAGRGAARLQGGARRGRTARGAWNGRRRAARASTRRRAACSRSRNGWPRPVPRRGEPAGESAILRVRRTPARRSSRFLGLNADDAEERNRPCEPT